MPMHGPMMMDQPPQMPPQMPPPGALGQALTGGPPVEPEGQDPLTGMLVQLLADPEARARVEAILAAMPPAGGMEGGMPGGMPVDPGMGGMGGMPGEMPY
jgi:hypothetical protein